MSMEIKTEGSPAEYVGALILVAKAGRIRVHCRISSDFVPLHIWPELVAKFGGTLRRMSRTLTCELPEGFTLSHHFTKEIEAQIQAELLPEMVELQPEGKIEIKDKTFVVCSTQ